MSIEIPQPSVALNAHDAPGAKYEMWETWNVPEHNTADDILFKTSILSIGAGEELKCLVINCHGLYGKGTKKNGSEKLISTGGFGLGLGYGIDLSNVSAFSNIRGLFKCIVINACGIAHVTNVGKDGDGELLCAEIARTANAFVVAPKIKQMPRYGSKLPPNHIDNFEGVVQRYTRSGSLDKSSLLGRNLIHDLF